MVTFRTALLLNERTNIVISNGRVHPVGQNPYLLLSATCDETLSWTIKM